MNYRSFKQEGRISNKGKSSLCVNTGRQYRDIHFEKCNYQELMVK
jgi:hypothetical protein